MFYISFCCTCFFNWDNMGKSRKQFFGEARIVHKNELYRKYFIVLIGKKVGTAKVSQIFLNKGFDCFFYYYYNYIYN